MLKRTLFVIVGLALLYQGMSCSVIYSGCSKDSECAETEACIKPQGEDKGECGIPEAFCNEGATRECEQESFDSDGNLRGECVGRTQVCSPEFSFIECRVAEVCDGLDNDCDGVNDNGVEGVGDACTVGTGVCEAAGQNICTTAGDVECDATAGAPEAGSCDCRDNNCDTPESMVDDFALVTPTLTTGTTASRTTWDFGVLGTTSRQFAAYEDGMGNIVVHDLTGAVQVDSFIGTDPLFVEGEQGGLILFYQADGEVTMDPPNPPAMLNSLHFRPVADNGGVGALGVPVCMSCVEQDPSNRLSPVVAYDAVYAYCLDETPGSCGYLAVYARQNGNPSSARVIEVTEILDPVSVGPVRSVATPQIFDVEIAMTHPEEAYMAFASGSPMNHSIAVVWARVSNRTQKNTESNVKTGLTGTPHYDIAAFEAVDPVTTVDSINFLLAYADSGVVNGVIQSRQFDSGTNRGPTVFSTGTGEFRNIEIAQVCSENAFVFWERVEADAHVVSGATIVKGFTPDELALRVDVRGNEVAGVMPRATVVGGELHFGFMSDAGGMGMVSGVSAVTPGVQTVTCDGG